MLSLNRDFSYRCEKFGALLYQYSTRSLVVIRSQLVLEILDHLCSAPSTDSLIDGLVARGYSEVQVTNAITQLEAKGIVNFEHRTLS